MIQDNGVSVPDRAAHAQIALEMAIAKLDNAKENLANAIVQAHMKCLHTVWVERPTYSIAEWLSPHAAIRICKNCRAEIQDSRIYSEWFSHGEYSHNKPDAVEMVLSPKQVGLNDIFQLRLGGDPRPFFKDFKDVLAWQHESAVHAPEETP